MTSEWATATDPNAPNEDRRPQDPDAPKRRGRPKGSTNGTSTPRVSGAGKADIESKIGTALATANALLSPFTNEYALEPQETVALTEGLTAEVMANAKLKKWMTMAVKASPHIVLGLAVISIAIPRLIHAGILPNGFNLPADPFNPPVSMEAGRASSGGGQDRNGEVYSYPTVDSQSAG